MPLAQNISKNLTTLAVSFQVCAFGKRTDCVRVQSDVVKITRGLQTAILVVLERILSFFQGSEVGGDVGTKAWLGRFGIRFGRHWRSAHKLRSDQYIDQA